MAGSGTAQRVDGRAGVVYGAETRAGDMVTGKEEWNQQWLENTANRVYSAYIPSILGRRAFEQCDYVNAERFIQIALDREGRPDERTKLIEEVEEVRAKL